MDEQPKPTPIISFTLTAAAHMLRTVDAARASFSLLKEIAPLLDNGTIIFGNKDLPERVKRLLFEAECIDKEMPNGSGN